MISLGAGPFVSRATELDEATLAVFKRNKCDDCHVPVERRVKDPKTGKPQYPENRDFSFVLDLERLKSSKYVTPGVPEKSELYKLIVKEKMPEGAEFCFDDTCPYPPLSEKDRSVIGEWIRALD